MKKIIYLLIVLFSVTSCIISGSYESNLHNIIDGTWRVNQGDTTFVFNNEGEFVVHWMESETLKDIKISGTYVVNLISDDKPHWIWEDQPEPEYSLSWITEDGKSGKLIYAGFIEDYNILKIFGLYGYENKVALLYRIGD